MSNYYNEGYTQGANNEYYGAPGQSYGGSGHSSYQPPREDGYEHDKSVARYDQERSRYGDNPRSSFSSNRGRDDDRRPDYEERDRDYDYEDRQRRHRSSSRPQSRGLRDHKEKDHHKGKDIGATLIGGAVGALAGRELGHNGMSSTIGALAGAFAGHELEKRHEKKKERREEEYEDRRSTGSRSGSRRRRSIYDADNDDDSYRRHPRHRQDLDNYD